MNIDAPATFFNTSEQIAVIGVSQNPKKFSRLVYENFKQKGYQVIPVNPHATSIGDELCYSSVAELPKGIQKAIIITKPDQTDAILNEIAQSSIRSVWVQQMSQTSNTQTIADSHSISVIMGKCAFMYTLPVTGIHAFHRGLVSLFGKL